MTRSKMYTIVFLTFIVFHQVSLPMEACKNIASQIFSKPSAEIFGYTAGSIIGYGMLHTFATSAITWHKKIDSIPMVSLDGFLKTLKPAVLLGASLVAATRIGSWPQLGISDLKYPALIAYASVSLVSLARGMQIYSALESPTYSSKREIQSQTTKIVHQCGCLASLTIPAYLLYTRSQIR